MPTQSELLQYKYSNETAFPKIIDLKEGANHEVYAKAFLIDERVNKNAWNVPNESMEKYSTGFIHRPLIMYPTFNHPDYLREGVVNDSKSFVDDILKVQNNYKVGEIIDVKYEPRSESPNKKAWYAYVRLTDKDFISKLKSGDVPFYVSPQVYDTNENPLYTDETGVEGTVSDFIPLHLAIVKEPAYGNVARIKGVCDGKGPVCINALKSAAETVIDHIDRFKDNKDNSSFFENLGSKDYKLTNKLYDENQQNQQAGNNSGGNFNYQPSNSNSSNDQPNSNTAFNTSSNPVATRTTIETETEDGKKITRSEDQRISKKSTNPSPEINQSPSTPTPNPNTAQTGGMANPTDPQIDVNVNGNPSQAIQLPKEVLDALAVVKQFQQDKENTDKELADLKQFKSNYEQERTKRAAEEQRGVIEGYFTEAVIADPTAREEMINFFSALNLTNDQLTKVLDLIVSGGFQSASVDKDGKKITKKHSVKSAGVEIDAGAIMNSVYNQRGYKPNSVFSEGLFGDINLENL